METNLRVCKFSDGLEVRLEHRPSKRDEISSSLGLLSEKMRRLTITSYAKFVQGGRNRGSNGFLCDKKVAPKLKGKFYMVVVRPIMLSAK